jgi:N-methylhydantoinase A
MTSISAGGGSIAFVDGGGFLNVGPQSAGADPGPACYGRGGTRPTVTDADLVCGFLNPDYFLGGAQALDIKASRDALATHIAGPLKMDLLDAAGGIQRIVDMRMADEIRVFAAKRGVDLSAFTLLPFGGAGAVHAAAVAAVLGMRRILVPPRPYSGQGYELRTPLAGLFEAHMTAESLTAVRARFDERHAQIHGHAAHERPVELVSYRLRVRVRVPKYKPEPEAPPASPRGIETAIKGRRRIHLTQRDSVHAILYERDQLEIGATVAGPAIIEQFDSTTVIPPSWSGSVDEFRNLILRRD